MRLLVLLILLCVTSTRCLIRTQHTLRRGEMTNLNELSIGAESPITVELNGSSLVSYSVLISLDRDIQFGLSTMGYVG